MASKIWSMLPSCELRPVRNFFSSAVFLLLSALELLPVVLLVFCVPVSVFDAEGLALEALSDAVLSATFKCDWEIGRAHV